MIASEARVAFLRRIHLFHDLKDEDLAAIAGTLDEETRNEGDEVFVQGDYGDRFFIIYRGRFGLRRSARPGRHAGDFVNRGYFGAEELLTGERPGLPPQGPLRRPATLFSVELKAFITLLKQFPKSRGF